MKKDVKVEIFGQSYVIRGEAEQEYTLQLADYVDRKMREISSKTTVNSSLKVAILAALNITDELFQLSQQQKADSELIEKKTSALLTLLEREV